MLNPKNSCFEADVCIVGAGPAGLTLARELAPTGLRLCLLESGGRKPDKVAGDLNAGTVESPQGYLAQTLCVGRSRQLGGSANLWNHQLRHQRSRFIRYVALDEIDFEPRDWIPLSGWPFSRRELLPFYLRAHEICGIGPFAWKAASWRNQSAASQPWQTPALDSIVSQFGEATYFQTGCLEELNQAANVSIFAGSVLLRLRTEDGSPETISSAEVVRSDGHRFMVKAAQFVLAAGGLENARILLLNEATSNGGPGNRHDQVGRCFMDHPSITLGILKPFSDALFDQATFYDQHYVDGVPIMGKLQLRAEVLRREKLLNACAVLVPHFRDLRSNFPEVLRCFTAKAWRNWASNRQPEPCFSLPDPPAGAPLSLHQRLLNGCYTEGFCGWSRLRHKARRFGQIALRSLVEQSPDPANRIVLGQAMDAFGQPRVKVLWHWNELDLRSVRLTQEVFREEFAAARLGEFTPTPETGGVKPREFASPHHFLGTTRMHQDPRQGVVDANGLVHGLQNLFVTGSSVFPTGGFANPTLTIIALALRLSDHLRTLLVAPGPTASGHEPRPAAVQLKE